MNKYLIYFISQINLPINDPKKLIRLLIMMTGLFAEVFAADTGMAEKPGCHYSCEELRGDRR